MKSNAMIVRAVAPWFGGKRTLAPLIVQQLGKHTQYFEPFCGSMAVLFAKDQCQSEIVNDLHGDVTNLAWVLQGPKTAEELYDRASKTLFAESMIRDYWKELGESECPSTVDTERAFKFFVTSWVMRNGISGTDRARGCGFSLAIRFTLGGGSPTVRFRSAIDSIPAWHDRLRNVVILRRDSFELFSRFDDDPKLGIYVDPPYLAESRSGFNGSGATSRYKHEFNHDPSMFGDDHTRLRDALSSFKRARIVISYYDSPRLRELYQDGWQFIDCSRGKNLSSPNQRGTSGATAKAPEVLIVNGDILPTS